MKRGMYLFYNDVVFLNLVYFMSIPKNYIIGVLRLLHAASFFRANCIS